MKIFVKTLKGAQFQIEVKPEDTVADVKNNIETVQGASAYPAAQQVLIHQGKVLKDDATLQENNVADSSFVVIMISKAKSSSGGGSSASAAPAPKAAISTTSVAPPPAATSAPSTTPAPVLDPAPSPAPAPAPVSAASPPTSETDVYGQAASNLVAGTTFDQTVQQILDMGGGTWDRDTVTRALRAAFNNPERAVDYLYSGIPEQADVPPVAQAPPTGQPPNPAAPRQPAQPASVVSSGPNANPLDLFPQGLPSVGSNAGAGGALDFLRDNPQFQALRAMVQANPQILQPMLQELGKQNPQLVSLIQEHQADFLQLINQPVEDIEAGILEQLPPGMSQTIEVTPEESEAIERLEAMGFDRETVLEVYFACNKNEELAANYLLDHMNDFED